MTRSLAVAFALALAAAAPPASAQSGKKVLFIDSYHQGYEWSDGVEDGAAKVLRPSGVTLEFVRMDTKRHGDEKWKKQAALDAKAAIERMKPDVVIVSDDNAVKYVLQAFYRDAALPFVFCGVNWDAKPYGLPYRNTTGMVEVGLTAQLVDKLKEYAKGKRVGYLTSESETERADQRAYKEKLKLDFTAERFVRTFAEWKEAFLAMQGQVDVLLLGNNAELVDWNEAEARAFVQAQSRIASGAIYEWMMPYAMLGLTKVPAEQGIFAAKSALAIMKGAAPTSIPIATNKEGQIFMNVKLAAKAGIVFKPELVRNAVVVK